MLKISSKFSKFVKNFPKYPVTVFKNSKTYFKIFSLKSSSKFEKLLKNYIILAVSANFVLPENVSTLTNDYTMLQKA